MAENNEEQSPENSEQEQSKVNSEAYENAENELFGELEQDSTKVDGTMDDSGYKLTHDAPEGFQHEEEQPTKETKEVEEKKETETKGTETAQETETKDTQWDDKIELGIDDKTKIELEKVDFGNGKIGYVPSDFKDGYLRQADYTKKTQEISDKEKNFETKVQERTKQITEHFQPYILELTALKYGNEFNKSRPIESEFVTASYDDTERAKQIDDYKKAVTEYEKEKGEYDKSRYNLQYNMQVTKSINDSTAKEFDEGLGKAWGVTSSTLIPEMMTYINPSITHGQMPMPKDTLEIFYKGKNFDKLVEAKIAEEKKKWADDIAVKVAKETPRPKTTENKPTKKHEASSIEEELVNEGYWN